jgi:hypothetical protein
VDPPPFDSQAAASTRIAPAIVHFAATLTTSPAFIVPRLPPPDQLAALRFRRRPRPMSTRTLDARWACLALAVLGATGCVYAARVTGPGGREAFRIHCSSRSQCADKAAEVCSGAYETLSTSTEMDGYVDNGTGYAGSPHELVVACRSTTPALDGGGGAVAPPPPALPAPPPHAEVSLCASAHASVTETAAYWAGLYPEAKRLEDPPAERDFIEVCRALPERVQRCLDAKYRDAHPKPCLAVLRRLDMGEKNKIDSLFLE